MDNIQALTMIELRIRGLEINDPTNHEIQRMYSAFQDVMSGMSPDEIAKWESRNDPEITEAEKAREREATNKLSSENKDGGSI